MVKVHFICTILFYYFIFVYVFSFFRIWKVLKMLFDKWSLIVVLENQKSSA